MTCEQAQVRVSGDWAYRKAWLAGTATAEREVFGGEGRAKPRKPGAGVLVQTEPVPVLPMSTFDVEAVREDEKGVAVKIAHGSENGYKKGCRKKDADTCPAKLAGGMSCYEVNAEIQRGYQARRKAREAAVAGPVAPKPVPVSIPAPEPVEISEAVWQAAVLESTEEAYVDASVELGRLRAENARLVERVTLLEMELDVAKSQVRATGAVQVGAERLPARVEMSVPGWGRVELRLGGDVERAS